jgi:hypothetical protein
VDFTVYVDLKKKLKKKLKDSEKVALIVRKEVHTALLSTLVSFLFLFLFLFLFSRAHPKQTHYTLHERAVQLCVRINNLEHIMDNIPYFCQKVDDTLGEEILGGKSFTTMMADTGTWLENTRQEIIDAIITKVLTCTPRPRSWLKSRTDDDHRGRAVPDEHLPAIRAGDLGAALAQEQEGAQELRR